MLFRSIIPAPKGHLTPQQVQQLTDAYFENAFKAIDHNVILVLCHNAETILSQAKGTTRKAPGAPTDNEVQAMREVIAAAYLNIGKLLENQGYQTEAQNFFKKSEKWGGQAHGPSQPKKSSRPGSIAGTIKGASSPSLGTSAINSMPSPKNQNKQRGDIATMPLHIFARNARPPAIAFKPPEPDTRLNDTPQLAYCLGLLRDSDDPDDIQDPATRNWLQLTADDADEQERLKTLATDVIRAFKRDELKDAKTVAEVVYLAPVLEKEDFRYLVNEFHSGIEQSGLLDIYQLEGLAQLIQGADPGHLEADALVKILVLLNARLADTHHQSPHLIYKLTFAVSHVLDAMADASVKDLDREKLHEPLSTYLGGLKKSTDPYLVYQAAYAFQALMCVPDNETIWQAAMRRTGKVIKGVSGLVSSVKGLDLNRFIESLMDIQQGLAGPSDVLGLFKSTYDDVTSLTKSGKRFMDCLKEGFSFDCKRAWYPALRGADTLIQDGQLAKFRKLVCEAPCRRDPAFQWGICQRLGDIAANSLWDAETRRNAIAFLGEIYRDDTVWGYQATVKQWILNILMQLASLSGDEMQFAETLLQELGENGDAKKQALYRNCQEEGHGSYPLKISLPALRSPSLLDRVQSRLDVEGTIRQLRRQRLKERGDAVYIPPQAKATLQAADDTRFPLMERVKGFLESEDKVFLLLGESGAGKSTFNRELEYEQWHVYKKKSGLIPLHINLPAIDKPEHDMIAKQLRKAEFTEPQIRELKLYRRFILICDGYDESQQTHNLYASNRLNQEGEWKAKMVISCRSEYLGVDYRDRFQPGDRNHRSEATLQEAVITPFSLVQVRDYIAQYVSIHQSLWGVKEYTDVLDLIPSLRELVKNPFLMSLSLEVLPRMVDPDQDFSDTRITRVALYDQFIENWLERGKRRLGEKNLSPQARAAFESLSDEGFTQNGVEFLKNLSVAIYKEQGGQPIVRYSRNKDEKTWKADFFSREEEKQLLREASPLTRSGNQHRFVHRSLLEYGLALAVFDPQDWKGKVTSESTVVRRASVSSDLSFVIHDTFHDDDIATTPEPDMNSPLAWRNFVNDPSVLQFLEERVQQETLFKQLLLDYIEHSKSDKKWRTAASNAITILVRAGVQFIGSDLQDIKIPGADISYGVFESAQLQGADLRHVNLRGVWMPQAEMSKACMTGAQFGELPYLRYENDDATSIAYSPDGKSFAVGLRNGTMHVYSALTWEKTWTLLGHSDKVSSIMFSSNSKHLVSGSRETSVRLWDVESGLCLQILSDHDEAVNWVAYSPDDRYVVSASDDNTLREWDVQSGKCRYTLEGHTETILRAVYSPKGDQIASCGLDSTIRLWSGDTGECEAILRGHIEAVMSVMYSCQGELLASAGRDKSVRIWDTEAGSCRHILMGHVEMVESAVFSPKGDRIASASYDGTVKLWDVKTGACLHSLCGHSGYVLDAKYSPTGDRIASVGSDGTVRIWNTEAGECGQTLSGHNGHVNNVQFSQGGDQVATSGNDGTVRLWDVRTTTTLHAFNCHRRHVSSVDYSPSGGQVVSSSSDGTIRLWGVKTGVCRHTLADHSGEVNCVAYSPHGDQIASAGQDETVRLWDAETGLCHHVLRGHIGSVLCVVYSQDGHRIASSGGDSTIRLWDSKTGLCFQTLDGSTLESIRNKRPYSVSIIMFSPQGDKIVSASEDMKVRLWDVETGKLLHILAGHDDKVTFVTYSPKGDQVATASSDMTVKLWDVESGVSRHTLTDHSNWVSSVAYSPRGDKLASSSTDSTVRLWDVKTGACLRSFTGHRSGITYVLYSPQGDQLISAGMDRTIRLWDATSGQCQAVVQVYDYVIDITWGRTCNVNYLFAGCQDGSVAMWNVTDDDHNVRLHWRATTGELIVKDAFIHDVRGLSQLNRQLLKQREAKGEPLHA